MGLLEKNDDYPDRAPHAYRLTAQGVAFLQSVREKIGRGNSIDWGRLKEIEFPSS